MIRRLLSRTTLETRGVQPAAHPRTDLSAGFDSRRCPNVLSDAGPLDRPDSIAGGVQGRVIRSIAGSSPTGELSPFFSP